MNGASAAHVSGTPQRHVARAGRQRSPDSEPPIDLDTMLDLTAKASVDGVKFDGVDLFLFAPHVSIDATDDELKRLADKIRARQARRRLAGRAGLAADRWRLGDGRRRRAQAVRDAGAEGLRDRRRSCASSASASTASCASIPRRARRTGRKIRQATPSGSRETFREACDVAEASASGSPPKEKSAGAACTAGSARSQLLEMVDRPEDARLPGRHGAHAAVHAGLQRARRSDPAATATTGTNQRDARRGAADDDARAASVDDRFPRRAERRDGEGLGLARQDRPALPARTIRTASSTSCATPASGCATTTASRRARSSTSAGTAACSPTRR